MLAPRSHLALRVALPVLVVGVAPVVAAGLPLPWVLLAAALAVLVSLVLAARLAHPLRRLEQAAQRLAAGDLSARAGFERGDEIGRLARAFDRMAGALGERDKGKSEFVARVSQELREPLASLRLTVAGLLDGKTGEVPAGQRAALDRAQAELERLLWLVNQFHDMAELESGAVEVKRERVELFPLAREVAVALQPLAGEHAVRIGIEGAGAVLGDRALLARVLGSLLEEALRLSPARSTVTIVLSPHGFRLKDPGPGVETSFTFEPFRQGAPYDTKNPGAGLGLALVRKLVEMNGGRLRVESGADAGLLVELPSA
jgi:signal transduction histidine kinase